MGLDDAPDRDCSQGHRDWRYSKTRGWRCRPCSQAEIKRWKRSIRLQAIEAYGGQCTCCGEGHVAFLVIDHVNGGGGVHRREMGKGGYQIYAWLKRHHYPEGFQVLCANCNMAKEFYPGGCPHLQARSA